MVESRFWAANRKHEKIMTQTITIILFIDDLYFHAQKNRSCKLMQECKGNKSVNSFTTIL